MKVPKNLSPVAAAASLALGLAAPSIGHAEATLFCAAEAPVFGKVKAEVSGGGVIHGGEGLSTLVRSNTKIVASGGSLIEGDAVSGGEVKLSGGSVVTGLMLEDVAPDVVPEDVHALVDTYAANNANHTIGLTDEGEVALEGTDLEVKGGDAITLTAGDYYLTEAKFSGGSTLRLEGAVRVYMPEGKFEISGGGLATDDAEGASLMVIMAGSGEVKASGGSNFHAAVYAPNAKFEISGDGNSWGAVVAHEMKLTGGSELYPHDVCRSGPPTLPPHGRELPDDGGRRM